MFPLRSFQGSLLSTGVLECQVLFCKRRVLICAAQQQEKVHGEDDSGQELADVVFSVPFVALSVPP